MPSLQGWRLTVLKNEGTNSFIEPERTSVLRIGSDIFCDVRIKHKLCPKVHCKIIADENHIKIKNLSKTIPISLNGDNFFGVNILQNNDELELFNQRFTWSKTKTTNVKRLRSSLRKSLRKSLRRRARDNNGDQIESSVLPLPDDQITKPLNVDSKNFKRRFTVHTKHSVTKTLISKSCKILKKMKKRITIHDIGWSSDSEDKEDFNSSDNEDERNIDNEEECLDEVPASQTLTPRRVLKEITSSPSRFLNKTPKLQDNLVPLEASTPLATGPLHHNMLATEQENKKTPSASNKYLQLMKSDSLIVSYSPQVHQSISYLNKSKLKTPSTTTTNLNDSELIFLGTPDNAKRTATSSMYLIDLTTPDNAYKTPNKSMSTTLLKSALKNTQIAKTPKTIGGKFSTINEISDSLDERKSDKIRRSLSVSAITKSKNTSSNLVRTPASITRLNRTAPRLNNTAMKRIGGNLLRTQEKLDDSIRNYKTPGTHLTPALASTSNSISTTTKSSSAYGITKLNKSLQLGSSTVRAAPFQVVQTKTSSLRKSLAARTVAGVDNLNREQVTASLQMDFVNIAPSSKVKRKLCSDIQDEKNDLTDVRGVRNLMKTPQKKNDNKIECNLNDLRGVRELLKTPKSNSNVSVSVDIRELMRTPKVDTESHDFTIGYDNFTNLLNSTYDKSTNVLTNNSIVSLPSFEIAPDASQQQLVDGGENSLDEFLKNEELSQIDSDEDDDIIMEETEADKVDDADVVNKTPEEIFDDLIGRPSIKHTYSRESISPKKENPHKQSKESPQKSTEDIEKWVESVTSVNFEDLPLKPNNNRQILSSRYSNVTPQTSIINPTTTTVFEETETSVITPSNISKVNQTFEIEEENDMESDELMRKMAIIHQETVKSSELKDSIKTTEDTTNVEENIDDELFSLRYSSNSSSVPEDDNKSEAIDQIETNVETEGKPQKTSFVPETSTDEIIFTCEQQTEIEEQDNVSQMNDTTGTETYEEASAKIIEPDDMELLSRVDYEKRRLYSRGHSLTPGKLHDSLDKNKRRTYAEFKNSGSSYDTANDTCLTSTSMEKLSSSSDDVFSEKLKFETGITDVDSTAGGCADSSKMEDSDNENETLTENVILSSQPTAIVEPADMELLSRVEYEKGRLCARGQSMTPGKSRDSYNKNKRRTYAEFRNSGESLDTSNETSLTSASTSTAVVISDDILSDKLTDISQIETEIENEDTTIDDTVESPEIPTSNITNDSEIDNVILSSQPVPSLTALSSRHLRPNQSTPLQKLRSSLKPQTPDTYNLENVPASTPLVSKKQVSFVKNDRSLQTTVDESTDFFNEDDLLEGSTKPDSFAFDSIAAEEEILLAKLLKSEIAPITYSTNVTADAENLDISNASLEDRDRSQESLVIVQEQKDANAEVTSPPNLSSISVNSSVRSRIQTPGRPKRSISSVSVIEVTDSFVSDAHEISDSVVAVDNESEIASTSNTSEKRYDEIEEIKLESDNVSTDFQEDDNSIQATEICPSNSVNNTIQNKDKDKPNDDSIVENLLSENTDDFIEASQSSANVEIPKRRSILNSPLETSSSKVPLTDNETVSVAEKEMEDKPTLSYESFISANESSTIEHDVSQSIDVNTPRRQGRTQAFVELDKEINSHEVEFETPRRQGQTLAQFNAEALKLQTRSTDILTPRRRQPPAKYALYTTPTHKSSSKEDITNVEVKPIESIVETVEKVSADKQEPEMVENAPIVTATPKRRGRVAKLAEDSPFQTPSVTPGRRAGRRNVEDAVLETPIAGSDETPVVAMVEIEESIAESSNDGVKTILETDDGLPMSSEEMSNVEGKSIVDEVSADKQETEIVENAPIVTATPKLRGRVAKLAVDSPFQTPSVTPGRRASRRNVEDAVLETPIAESDETPVVAVVEIEESMAESSNDEVKTILETGDGLPMKLEEMSNIEVKPIESIVETVEAVSADKQELEMVENAPIVTATPKRRGRVAKLAEDSPFQTPSVTPGRRAGRRNVEDTVLDTPIAESDETPVVAVVEIDESMAESSNDKVKTILETDDGLPMSSEEMSNVEGKSIVETVEEFSADKQEPEMVENAPIVTATPKRRGRVAKLVGDSPFQTPSVTPGRRAGRRNVEDAVLETPIAGSDETPVVAMVEIEESIAESSNDGVKTILETDDGLPMKLEEMSNIEVKPIESIVETVEAVSADKQEPEMVENAPIVTATPKRRGRVAKLAEDSPFQTPSVTPGRRAGRRNVEDTVLDTPIAESDETPVGAVVEIDESMAESSNDKVKTILETDDGLPMSSEEMSNVEGKSIVETVEEFSADKQEPEMVENAPIVTATPKRRGRVAKLVGDSPFQTPSVTPGRRAGRRNVEDAVLETPIAGSDETPVVAMVEIEESIAESSNDGVKTILETDDGLPMKLEEMSNIEVKPIESIVETVEAVSADKQEPEMVENAPIVTATPKRRGRVAKLAEDSPFQTPSVTPGRRAGRRNVEDTVLDTPIAESDETPVVAVVEIDESMTESSNDKVKTILETGDGISMNSEEMSYVEGKPIESIVETVEAVSVTATPKRRGRVAKLAEDSPFQTPSVRPGRRAGRRNVEDTVLDTPIAESDETPVVAVVEIEESMAESSNDEVKTILETDDGLPMNSEEISNVEGKPIESIVETVEEFSADKQEPEMVENAPIVTATPKRRGRVAKLAEDSPFQTPSVTPGRRAGRRNVEDTVLDTPIAESDENPVVAVVEIEESMAESSNDEVKTILETDDGLPMNSEEISNVEGKPIESIVETVEEFSADKQEPEMVENAPIVTATPKRRGRVAKLAEDSPFQTPSVTPGRRAGRRNVEDTVLDTPIAESDETPVVAVVEIEESMAESSNDEVKTILETDDGLPMSSEEMSNVELKSIVEEVSADKQETEIVENAPIVTATPKRRGRVAKLAVDSPFQIPLVTPVRRAGRKNVEDIALGTPIVESDETAVVAVVEIEESNDEVKTLRKTDGGLPMKSEELSTVEGKSIQSSQNVVESIPGGKSPLTLINKIESSECAQDVKSAKTVLSSTDVGLEHDMNKTTVVKRGVHIESADSTPAGVHEKESNIEVKPVELIVVVDEKPTDIVENKLVTATTKRHKRIPINLANDSPFIAPSTPVSISEKLADSHQSPIAEDDGQMTTPRKRKPPAKLSEFITPKQKSTTKIASISQVNKEDSVKSTEITLSTNETDEENKEVETTGRRGRTAVLRKGRAKATNDKIVTDKKSETDSSNNDDVKSIKAESTFEKPFATQKGRRRQQIKTESPKLLRSSSPVYGTLVGEKDEHLTDDLLTEEDDVARHTKPESPFKKPTTVRKGRRVGKGAKVALVPKLDSTESETETADDKKTTNEIIAKTSKRGQRKRMVETAEIVTENVSDTNSTTTVEDNNADGDSESSILSKDNEEKSKQRTVRSGRRGRGAKKTSAKTDETDSSRDNSNYKITVDVVETKDAEIKSAATTEVRIIPEMLTSTTSDEALTGETRTVQFGDTEDESDANDKRKIKFSKKIDVKVFGDTPFKDVLPRKRRQVQSKVVEDKKDEVKLKKGVMKLSSAESSVETVDSDNVKSTSSKRGGRLNRKTNRGKTTEVIKESSTESDIAVSETKEDSVVVPVKKTGGRRGNKSTVELTEDQPIDEVVNPIEEIVLDDNTTSRVGSRRRKNQETATEQKPPSPKRSRQRPASKKIESQSESNKDNVPESNKDDVPESNKDDVPESNKDEVAVENSSSSKIVAKRGGRRGKVTATVTEESPEDKIEKVKSEDKPEDVVEKHEVIPSRKRGRRGIKETENTLTDDVSAPEKKSRSLTPKKTEDTTDHEKPQDTTTSSPHHIDTIQQNTVVRGGRKTKKVEPDNVAEAKKVPVTSRKRGKPIDDTPTAVEELNEVAIDTTAKRSGRKKKQTDIEVATSTSTIPAKRALRNNSNPVEESTGVSSKESESESSAALKSRGQKAKIQTEGKVIPEKIVPAKRNLRNNSNAIEEPKITAPTRRGRAK